MTTPGWKPSISTEKGSGWNRSEHALSDKVPAPETPEAEFANEMRSGFESESASGRERARYLNRIIVRVGDKIVLLLVRDIFWIQSHGNYLRLHVQNATYEHRMTIKDIYKYLDPDCFIRVHRSVIINLDHVADFDLPRNGNAFVHLRNGKALPISRTGRVILRRGLLGYSCISTGIDEA
jgi:DNA-binding LytR/AlgR family response regulator